ncbi:hypothetical protein [Rahnella inusitata]|uniref:hypothetical protein n=1 Tax=Rahnella inusitata TaxID=58169 RepID=UPI0039AEE988
MSERRHITTSALGNAKGFGLVYTKILGWIDLGHARGDDSRRLKRILFEEKERKFFPEFNDWYFPVDYFQEMKKSLYFNIEAWGGVNAPLMVRSCLSRELKNRIALTIMMKTAWRFEAFQASSLLNWFSDSGFSCEDLVSDLVGFYRVFGNGIDPLVLAQPTDIAYGRSIWDFYGPVGNFKNKGFRPLLFPEPNPLRKPLPRFGYIPTWLNYIQPLGDLSNKYISNRFVKYPYNNFFDDKNRLNRDLYISLRKKVDRFAPESLDIPSHFYIHPHYPVAPDYFHFPQDYLK